MDWEDWTLETHTILALDGVDSVNDTGNGIVEGPGEGYVDGVNVDGGQVTKL